MKVNDITVMGTNVVRLTKIKDNKIHQCAECDLYTRGCMDINIHKCSTTPDCNFKLIFRVASNNIL